MVRFRLNHGRNGRRTIMRQSTVSRRGLSLVLAPLALVAVLGGRLMAYGGGSSPAPEITGQTWINAAPMHMTDLKGKIVLVEFWTFGCFNCRNVGPQGKGWHEQCAEQGLMVIGV